MTKKNNSRNDEIEYAIFCDELEKQYPQAKEVGLFEVLKVLGLDKKNSDKNLVKAVEYFNKKDGVIEKDAPMDFLTEREKRIISQDGKFRPDLYCMLLSTKFADGIQNKSAFIEDSLSYAFDSK